MGKQTKSRKPVVHHIPITKARINLGQVVRRAHLNRESFVLEKDGIPVAGIMNVDDMEDWLEQQDPSMSTQIAEGHAEYQKGDTTSLDAFITDVRKKSPASEKASNPCRSSSTFGLPPASVGMHRSSSSSTQSLWTCSNSYKKCSRQIPTIARTNTTSRSSAFGARVRAQWRVRVGDYRVRYDIAGNDVVLYSFRHRREVY